jgi:CysZ protein
MSMNSGTSGLQLALCSWFESWRFIFRNHLSHYFIYPLAITALLAMGSVAIINRGVSFIMGFINPYFESQAITGSWWEKILEVLKDSSSFALPFILWVISIYVFFRLNKYAVLVLMSPVMSLLSEKTNDILENTNTPFSLSKLIQDSIRGSVISFRNLVVELLLTLAIWGFILVLMLFLPYLIFILAPLAAMIVFFIGSYYYGFAVLDYVNERNQLNVRDSIRDIRKNRTLSICLGAIFSILFMIPFIGISLSTVTSTVAAAIAKHRIQE